MKIVFLDFKCEMYDIMPSDKNRKHFTSTNRSKFVYQL